MVCFVGVSTVPADRGIAVILAEEELQVGKRFEGFDVGLLPPAFVGWVTDSGGEVLGRA